MRKLGRYVDGNIERIQLAYIYIYIYIYICEEEEEEEEVERRKGGTCICCIEPYTPLSQRYGIFQWKFARDSPAAQADRCYDSVQERGSFSLGSPALPGYVCEHPRALHYPLTL